MLCCAVRVNVLCCACQVRWQVLDERWLGYEVLWQSQYPWRAVPAATAFPMLGRARASVLVRPAASLMPAALRLDFRYFTKPRYM